MPTVDFQICGSVAKGNATSFYFRPNGATASAQESEHIVTPGLLSSFPRF